MGEQVSDSNICFLGTIMGTAQQPEHQFWWVMCIVCTPSTPICLAF
jgi:hypothetical protein